ncbi:MAG: hypothetical protein KDE47_20050, partial [Caldilineaceae bacterium]|nr:hypothetical protein [Caldilineaceae bacterium]
TRRDALLAVERMKGGTLAWPDKLDKLAPQPLMANIAVVSMPVESLIKFRLLYIKEVVVNQPVG